jgi:hypothetical protein
MQVSFSKINITPKDVIGKAMAGYSRPDPCKGILDEIQAYGVLIESNNDNKKLLLLSVDILKLPLSVTNYIKNKIITEFTSLDSNQILIHATHTHSAPDITGEFYWPGFGINVLRGIMFGVNRNDDYIVWFTKQIIEMVKELFKNLKSCKIVWSSKKFNPDLVIQRRHPTKKIQPRLGVITFKDIKEEKLIGFITHYACHPTSLSFENNKLSADWPGRFNHRIAELTNNSISSIYFNGPSGDLNPITTCGTDYEYLDKNKNLVYNQLGDYQDAIRIGYNIAEEALRLAKSMKDSEYFEELDFEVYLKSFLIPSKDHKYFSKKWISNKLVHVIKKFLLMPIAKILGENANFSAFTIKRIGGRLNISTVIQYIKVKAYSDSRAKEFSLTTVPGELFEDLGEILLKKSPTGVDDSFIIQNGNDWIAYLFSLKEYAEYGGYEAQPTFSPICGARVMKEVKHIFNKELQINNK